MLSQHLVLATLYHGSQLALSKTIRIGDTLNIRFNVVAVSLGSYDRGEPTISYK